ncbi:MAG: cyclic nucleotide-binding domain-containing protein [Elusimicrobiota bacterium]
MQKLEMNEMDYGRLASAMRRVDFFAPLTVGQLEMVLPYVLYCRYRSGERVCKQGDRGDAFYVVRDGAVSVRVRSRLLLTREVARLGAGEFFGETALLTDDPRNATVVCAAPTRLFVLLTTDFRYVFANNPQFAAKVRKIAETRQFIAQHQF